MSEFPWELPELTEAEARAQREADQAAADLADYGADRPSEAEFREQEAELREREHDLWGGDDA